MAKYTKKNVRKNNRKSKKRPIKKTHSKRKYKGGNPNHRYGAKFLFEKSYPLNESSSIMSQVSLAG